jgi:hypothetical protein
MQVMMNDDFSPNGALPKARTIWLPVVLIALALVLRVVKSTAVGADVLPNFSPWMALAFAGTLLFPRVLPWWGVVAGMLLLDGVVQGGVLLDYPGTMALVYGLFALAAVAGVRLRGKVGGLGTVAGAVVCSGVFYGVTNTLSWAVMPEYAKSVAGWAQAMTTGLPGFPPTWTFLRNSLLSDAGFSVLLVLAHNVEASVRRMPRLVWAKA